MSSKPFKQVWNENPFTGSLKDYTPQEIIAESFYDYDRLTTNVYPEIKCLIIDIYRGVNCWSIFGKYIKKCFPNLEMLFVNQAYTFCQNPGHFLDFMNDPWLKKIFICTSEETQFESTPTRIFHNFDNCCVCRTSRNQCIWNCECRWLQHNIMKCVESSSIQIQDDNSDFRLRTSDTCVESDIN